MVEFLKKVIKYGSYVVVIIDILKYGLKLLEANESGIDTTNEPTS